MSDSEELRLKPVTFRQGVGDLRGLRGAAVSEWTHEWTHDIEQLRDAHSKTVAAMHSCTAWEEHGCDEWDGMCDACAVRVDYLSALARLIELTLERDP